MVTRKTAAIARCFRRFVGDRSAVTSIEYAIMASAIAFAIAVAVRSLGTSVYGLYSSIATAVQ